MSLKAFDANLRREIAKLDYENTQLSRHNLYWNSVDRSHYDHLAKDGKQDE